MFFPLKEEMKSIFLNVTFLALLLSCAGTRNKGSGKDPRIELNNFRSMEKEDFVDHLAAFENFYLNSNEVKLFRLSVQDEKYLASISADITENNELFFTEGKKPVFRVVKSSVPFHFSLPGMRIFFSTGLVSKYLKSEKLLYSVLAYELIRSEKNIYRKVQIAPTGYMTTPRILSLLKLDTTEKAQTHKWAYYTLKRVGVDPDTYLSWLQIQNRNSADFALQLGDTGSISREESLFKAFIVANAGKKTSLSKYESSSRDFYSFVNRIKR